MAVVFDATSSGSSASVDPLTFSHTVGTNGSNVCLVVGFCLRIVGGQSIVSVKYGGDIMTEVTNLNTPDGDSNVGLYYLASPTVGANNVVIELTGADRITAIASSYFNVDQNDAIGTFLTDTGTDPSVALTAQDGWMCVDHLGADAGNENTSAFCANTTEGAGQTERGCVAAGGGGGSGASAMSDEVGAASVTMSYTVNGTDYSPAYIAVPLKEAAAPRGRAVRYLHNTIMSRLVGRTKIIDVLGRDVPLEQLQADEWIRTDGPFFPTPTKYSSSVEDPSTAYIESLRISGNKVTIETAKESLLESLFRRLGRSS